MATYQEIQNGIKDNHSFVPKTCWIANRKEEFGIPVKQAFNRQSDIRIVLCPEQKKHIINGAFAHFGILEESQINAEN